MATAGDQINYALRLLGVLAEGESPSAATSADGLTALNQMLDSWSTERLSVYGTQTHEVTWPAGEVYQDIGPGGSGAFGVNPGPLQIDPATYYVVNGISYPITLVNQEQYNNITLKDTTSTLPLVMWPNMMLLTTMNIRMHLWPVPSQDLEFHIVCVKELTQIADLGDDIIVPAGYLRAFAYNLAVELAPQFGIEASQTVKRIAAVSKRNIKRINNPGDKMSMPAALVANTYGFNIYSGGFQ